MEYKRDLKKKAEEVWDMYFAFKDELNNLEGYAREEGIEGAEELDFTDTFIDLNEELGTVLEKLFGITCFEEE